MCGFGRDNFLAGESIRKTEVEVRMGNLKNKKTAGKEGITGEMVKGG